MNLGVLTESLKRADCGVRPVIAVPGRIDVETIGATWYAAGDFAAGIIAFMARAAAVFPKALEDVAPGELAAGDVAGAGRTRGDPLEPEPPLQPEKAIAEMRSAARTE